MAAEAIYDQLAATAKGFIQATRAITSGANNPDYDLIRSYAAPEFRVHWAPKLFAESSPVLSGSKDIEGFCEHIRQMASKFTTWTIHVRDLFVDVQRRTVVARTDFWIVPRGSEQVRNDIVFFVKLDESGSKVVDLCEYVDPMANGIIRDRILASR